MGDFQEKRPDHLQTELGLSHMWPERVSNPQRWDDEQFRALKINHLATGATLQYLWCLMMNNDQTVYDVDSKSSTHL